MISPKGSAPKDPLSNFDPGEIQWNCPGSDPVCVRGGSDWIGANLDLALCNQPSPPGGGAFAKRPESRCDDDRPDDQRGFSHLDPPGSIEPSSGRDILVDHICCLVRLSLENYPLSSFNGSSFQRVVLVKRFNRFLGGIYAN